MRGIWTALVTPFKENLEIDWEAFRAILEDQKAAKVAGVIPCGTTGESPTLSVDEKKKLIQVTLEVMKGSGVGVVAGTGSNSTPETVELSRWASSQGVDGVLIVTPYYNKPSQAGMEAHFHAVAEAVTCTVVLYNVPGRTGVNLAPETIAKLAKHPRIRALKEATGNVALTSEIRSHLKLAGQKLDILSGDDATFLPLLCVGASGVISVASNLFPRAMVALQEAFEKGDQKKALELHDQYTPLFRDLFVESNPVPIKAALQHTGFCGPTVRPPLAPLGAESRKRLGLALEHGSIPAGSASHRTLR